uniref:Uncharacterized protein n=1 Tax=Romanomermis culicivorax TaxID=13658 RepID=A0A915KWT9_ROMCU
MEIFYENLLKF